MRALIEKMDRGGVDEASEAAQAFKEDAGPALVISAIEGFALAKTWKTRAVLVSMVGPASRKSRPACDLALRALEDKSPNVAYRAAEVLAYSQRRDMIAELQKASKAVKGATRKDIAAAIDAIRSGNHNYYRDRSHSDAIFWDYG